MNIWPFRKLALVRADVARLPFATGSLAAIHAGAAIHCWPDPTAAVQHLVCFKKLMQKLKIVLTSSVNIIMSLHAHKADVCMLSAVCLGHSYTVPNSGASIAMLLEWYLNTHHAARTSQCPGWILNDVLVPLQMVEISRVLKPGGVFVASTFLKTFSPLGEVFGDDTVRPLNQVLLFLAQHV